jgi:lysophospholipase L1-like esterase
MTKTILIFGDSNTWGYDPESTPGNGKRFPIDVRWPGILQAELGTEYRVIDEGLGGRTTVREDPVEENRCGKQHLIPILDSHAPLHLVIIFLGTNDLKSRFNVTAHEISLGAGLLVQKTLERKKAFINREPKVLLVAPPPTAPLDGTIFEDLFKGALEKSLQFGKYFKAQAEAHGVDFFDCGQLICSSEKDGIHLDASTHKTLGLAMAAKIKDIFGTESSLKLEQF